MASTVERVWHISPGRVSVVRIAGAHRETHRTRRLRQRNPTAVHPTCEVPPVRRWIDNRTRVRAGGGASRRRPNRLSPQPSAKSTRWAVVAFLGEYEGSNTTERSHLHSCGGGTVRRVSVGPAAGLITAEVAAGGSRWLTRSGGGCFSISALHVPPADRRAGRGLIGRRWPWHPPSIRPSRFARGPCVWGDVALLHRFSPLSGVGTAERRAARRSPTAAVTTPVPRGRGAASARRASWRRGSGCRAACGWRR